jgi:hypothetical protein
MVLVLHQACVCDTSMHQACANGPTGVFPLGAGVSAAAGWCGRSGARGEPRRGGVHRAAVRDAAVVLGEHPSHPACPAAYTNTIHAEQKGSGPSAPVLRPKLRPSWNAEFTERAARAMYATAGQVLRLSRGTHGTPMLLLGGDGVWCGPLGCEQVGRAVVAMPSAAEGVAPAVAVMHLRPMMPSQRKALVDLAPQA